MTVRQSVLDVAGEWRKASASYNNDGCVELAVQPGVTGIRDTKNRSLGHLVMPDAARAALVAFARVTA